MSEHMSAAEYRRQVIEPAINADGAMSDEEFKQALKGNTNIAKKRISGVRFVETKNEPKKPRNHEEDDITIQVTEYLEVLLLQKKITAFSHVPQETFTKSWVTKKKNKAMGVRAGVPDMLIVYPDAVLFLELKRLKNGVVSEAQKSWLQALQGVRDKTASEIYAEVACGFDQAKALIDYHLE